MAGEEVTRIIAEQRALELRYEELVATRAALKVNWPAVLLRVGMVTVLHHLLTALVQGLSNKTRYKEVQTEMQHLNSALRESTRNLARALKVQCRAARA